jgi:hypothetical protein
MNYLKIAGIAGIAATLLLSACSWGPMTATHKYGHLPKLYMETPVEDMRFRIYSLDTIDLRLKKKFN